MILRYLEELIVTQGSPGASPLYNTKCVWLVDMWLEEAGNQHQILTLGSGSHPALICWTQSALATSSQPQSSHLVLIVPFLPNHAIAFVKRISTLSEQHVSIGVKIPYVEQHPWRQKTESDHATRPGKIFIPGAYATRFGTLSLGESPSTM